MNDVARERLSELMTSYGAGLCATPRMCEILLKQKCPEFPAEVQVLTQAVQNGTVNRLMKVRRPEEWEQVSVRLVGELTQTGVQEDEARWAVESWAVALGKHPNWAAAPPPPRPDWNKLPEHEVRPDEQKGALYHPAAGAVCGAIGGGLGPLATLLLLLIILSAVVDVLPDQFQGKGKALVLLIIIFTVINMFIGALFGAVGGGFGLFVARHLTGDTRGSLFWAKGGALMGAMLGAAIGVKFLWPVGLVIGALLGGWLGAFSSARASLTKRY